MFYLKKYQRKVQQDVFFKIKKAIYSIARGVRKEIIYQNTKIVCSNYPSRTRKLALLPEGTNGNGFIIRNEKFILKVGSCEMNPWNEGNLACKWQGCSVNNTIIQPLLQYIKDVGVNFANSENINIDVEILLPELAGFYKNSPVFYLSSWENYPLDIKDTHSEIHLKQIGNFIFLPLWVFPSSIKLVLSKYRSTQELIVLEPQKPKAVIFNGKPYMAFIIVAATPCTAVVLQRNNEKTTLGKGIKGDIVVLYPLTKPKLK